MSKQFNVWDKNKIEDETEMKLWLIEAQLTIEIEFEDTPAAEIFIDYDRKATQRRINFLQLCAYCWWCLEIGDQQTAVTEVL